MSYTAVFVRFQQEGKSSVSVGTMTECCIETISNRQEGSLEELKLTPIAVFIQYAGGQPFQTSQTPGKYSRASRKLFIADATMTSRLLTCAR